MSILLKFSQLNASHSVFNYVNALTTIFSVRCASKKSAGTSKNKRKPTKGKHRGPKAFSMDFVKAGTMIYKQLGLRRYPGENVGLDKRKNLIALRDGIVLTSYEELSPYPDSPLYGPVQAGRVLHKKFYHVISEDRPPVFKLVSQI